MTNANLRISGFKSKETISFQLGKDFNVVAVKYIHFNNQLSFFFPDFNCYYHELEYSDILELREKNNKNKICFN